jgi:AMP deaminase
LSGSEPRIFPGIVSRTQRRDSRAGQAVRQGSQSETDGDGSVGKGSVGKARQRNSMVVDGSVDEKAGESDGEMEEAGGMDEWWVVVGVWMMLVKEFQIVCLHGFI